MMRFVMPLWLGLAVVWAADEKNYQAAMSLIDGKEYQEALVKLGAEIQSNSSRADAALYWSAYAANKLGDSTLALKRLAEMQAKFSTSRWMNDARALQLEINQASGKKVSPEEQADEELKLMAIQGLMSADPARSVPLLEEILNSPQKSLKLKKQALFVLSQSGSSRAQETVGKFAKGNGNPELQKEAIHTLGIGGRRNGPILEDIYRNVSDVSVKKEVLHGLFIGQSAKQLVELARSEKDLQLKKEAVRLLSMMQGKEATDYMAELLK